MSGLIAAWFGEVNLTDVILVTGLVMIGFDRIADVKGWGRSSRTLRIENEDLIRRNGELEDTVGRHEKEIDRLKGQVADLERTNQAAVLKSLNNHEAMASKRNEHRRAAEAEIVGLLTQIRDTLKGDAQR